MFKYCRRVELGELSSDECVVTHGLTRMRKMRYIDVMNMMLHVRGNYHEFIDNDAPQKPRFDIDDHDETMLRDGIVPLELIQCLLHAIRDSIATNYNARFIPKKHVTILTSSSNVRVSFHVVLNGYRCSDADEVRRFYDSVMECMKSNLNYDSYTRDGRMDNVTKGTQFRLLGSESATGGRVKRILDEYMYEGEMITSFEEEHYELPESLQHSEIFFRSLVTFVNRSMPLISIHEATKSESHVSFTSHAFDKRDCMNLFRIRMGTVGKYRDTVGAIVNVARTRRSRCDLCMRSHDSEGWFMVVNSRGVVRLYCRRNTTDFLEIGTVNVSTSHEGVQEEEKEELPYTNILDIVSEDVMSKAMSQNFSLEFMQSQEQKYKNTRNEKAKKRQAGSNLRYIHSATRN